MPSQLAQGRRPAKLAGNSAAAACAASADSTAAGFSSGKERQPDRPMAAKQQVKIKWRTTGIEGSGRDSNAQA
jgi:hypothetical protein